MANNYTSYVAKNQTEGVALDEVFLRYQYSNYVIDPNRYRFRKVVRIIGLVYLFIKNLKKRIGKTRTVAIFENEIPERFKFWDDKFLVTTGETKFPFACAKGLVIELEDVNLLQSLNYFYKKATLEVKRFVKQKLYQKISVEKGEILYYSGRILPSQRIDNKIQLSDVCMDLSDSSFCVPLVDKHSPIAFAIINEVHWYDLDASHGGVETLCRYVLKHAYIFDGRVLVQAFKDQCARCRFLLRKAIDVAMSPKASENLTIAPPFYYSQADLFGPYNSYSNVNKRATSKVWFAIFCCCVTGAVDLKVMEDYATNSFVLAFVRFCCKVGFPGKLLPDAGSQLIKGCETMSISFYDVHNKLSEFGVDFEPCPVGAHYMHGKVERKIKDVKASFSKCLHNERLSIIRWETLGDQIANCINNLPIGLGNVTKDLENLDL